MIALKMISTTNYLGGRMNLDDKIDLQISKLKTQISLMKKKKFEENSSLHSGEFALMKQIARHKKILDKNPSLVILSQNLQITQATVTPLVDRLVAKGFVIKQNSETDKRAKVVSLTEKGFEVLLKNREEERARIQGLLEHLGSEDTEHLIRILEKITNYF